MHQLLNHIASRNGWPLADLTMEIKDKKAVNVNIGGIAIDSLATYTVAE